MMLTLNHHDKAVDCYRRAVQLRPDLDEAWLNLGRALRSLRRV